MSRQILCPQASAVNKLFEPAEQDRDTGVQRRMRTASNAGLVWNRYLDLWLWRDGAPLKPEEGTECRAVLDAFAKGSNAPDKFAQPPLAAKTKHPSRPQDARAPDKLAQPPLAARLLEAVHARQKHVLARWRGGGRGKQVQGTLAARFATGLGGPHPTEVGFTFDRSIGIPYLPGSSVKGVARAAAQLRDDPSRGTLFGPDRIERDDDASIGDLVFLDAYPMSLPQLEVDIINCHHPHYYANSDAGRPAYPSETEDPIPVYFLTVAAGTKWMFRLLSRSGEHAARGAELLRFGLAELGAGAKTAVGYGTFAI